VSAERKEAILATVAGLATAWIAFDVLVFLYGESPRHLFALLFDGTWGSPYGAGQVLFKATPLLFTGIAVDLALRAGLFNIGAEGQLAVGSLTAGIVGAVLPAWLPGPLAVPVTLLAAAAAGAAWALIPAILRARFRAHEVISTIMMNRIADAAIGLVLGLGFALKGTVRTQSLAAGAHVPRLERFLPALRGSAVSVSLFAGVLLALFVGWSYRGTRFGREVSLVGMNPIACAAERIAVRGRLAQTLILSGAICGLVSSATVLGYKGYFEQGLGAGAGFGGLAVALLGRGSGVGLVLAALLFGTLQQGGLAINAYVPMELMDVIQGVVITSVALADARVRGALVRSARGAFG
jgi:general nucleoside transport system permease protein